MVAKGYTTVNLVDEELGHRMGGAQFEQCARLIEQAEAWIDRETGRSWMVDSPIVGELHTITSPTVFLEHKPVLSISSVTVRSQTVGASSTTLTAGSGYELVDAVHGILLLSGYAYQSDPIIETTTSGYHGYLLTVSYTTTDPTPLPADLQRAATLLVAQWMQPAFNQDQRGIKSYSVGGELSVTFADTEKSGGVPAEVLRLVRAHERVIIA